MSGYAVRWSRRHKSTLEITDPDGQVHEVSATQAGIPRSWVHEAGTRLSADKLRQGQKEQHDAQEV